MNMYRTEVDYTTARIVAKTTKPPSFAERRSMSIYGWGLFGAALAGDEGTSDNKSGNSPDTDSDSNCIAIAIV